MPDKCVSHSYTEAELADAIEEKGLYSAIFFNGGATDPYAARDMIVAALRNAAPQPSTAKDSAGPSQEGLGQGDAAVAAPITPPAGPSGELERAVLDAAMKWYRFTLEQGLDATDYHADSREQWMACDRLAKSSPPATPSRIEGEKNGI